MKREIGIIRKSESVELEKLLRVSFGRAEGFVVSPHASLWTQAEDVYPTLGYFIDGRLCSSMRVEWVLSQRELDYKMNGSVQGPRVTFPAVYLTKAGTHPEFAEQGLNGALRYAAIKMAENWGARFMIGSVLENATRVFSMQQMGYQFFLQGKAWNGSFVSERKALIAILDLADCGSKALEYLQTSFPDSINETFISGDVMDRKISQNDSIRWPWSA